MGALPARLASRTANWIAAAHRPCGNARRFRCAEWSDSSVTPVEDGAALCLISNLYHAQLSLPVCLEPSIHFTRPIATMSEQWGMNGAACLVCAQSASSSNHVGAMFWKCAISRMHQVA